MAPNVWQRVIRKKKSLKFKKHNLYTENISADFY